MELMAGGRRLRKSTWIWKHFAVPSIAAAGGLDAKGHTA